MDILTANETHADAVAELFAKAFRKRGVGCRLMNRARQLAVEVGAARIDLETAHDNLPGQALYEQLGYVRCGEEFRTYSLEIAASPTR